MWRGLRARAGLSGVETCMRSARGDTTKTSLAFLSLSRVSEWGRASGCMLFGPLPRIHSVPLMMQRAGGSERMRVRCHLSNFSTCSAVTPVRLREQKGAESGGRLRPRRCCRRTRNCVARRVTDLSQMRNRVARAASALVRCLRCRFVSFVIPRSPIKWTARNARPPTNSASLTHHASCSTGGRRASLRRRVLHRYLHV